MFMVGLLMGTALFSLTFSWIKPLFFAAKGPKSQTLAQLFGLPVWAILVILAVLAIFGFWLGNRFEAQGKGTISVHKLMVDKNI